MNKKKLILCILILLVIIFAIILIVASNKQETNQKVVSIELDEETANKMKEAEQDAIKEKLSNLSETKRVEYYVTEFIKALENRQCKTAYGMLNNDFKKNYFATYESFDAYVKKYIPKNIATKYNNIERLGQIYVMEIEISDVLTTVNPNNYSGYIVLKENDYNDFELSFSVDSAMKNIDGDQEEEEE